MIMNQIFFDLYVEFGLYQYRYIQNYYETVFRNNFDSSRNRTDDLLRVKQMP